MLLPSDVFFAEHFSTEFSLPPVIRADDKASDRELKFYYRHCGDSDAYLKEKMQIFT